MKGKEIILGILQDGPHTGYEINDIFQTRLNHFFDGTFGMIYPTLKKLEIEGLVSKEQVAQTDKPNKNVYFITPAGEKVFSVALLKPTSDEVLKSDFLMRLYFSEQLPEEQVIAFIKEEIARKSAKLVNLKEQLNQWVGSGMTTTQKIAFNYGIAYYKSTLAVLNDTLAQYKNGTE